MASEKEQKIYDDLLRGLTIYFNEWEKKKGHPVIHEVERPAKLYRNKEAKDKRNKLPDGALRLLVFIADELISGKDIIALTHKRYYKVTGKSYNTYKSALKRLLIDKFIVYIGNDRYIVNPRYLYCGSRMIKYEKYCHINKSTKEKPP